jgi:hypothetical protein
MGGGCSRVAVEISHSRSTPAAVVKSVSCPGRWRGSRAESGMTRDISPGCLETRLRDLLNQDTASPTMCWRLFGSTHQFTLFVVVVAVAGRGPLSQRGDSAILRDGFVSGTHSNAEIRTLHSSVGRLNLGT